MKKLSFLLFLFPLVLGSCSLIDTTSGEDDSKNRPNIHHGTHTNDNNDDENQQGGNSETGGNEQGSNGNTSSEWTCAWTGIQLDIVKSMFNGYLPCLKAFNKYEIKCMDGSNIPYFNPYVEGWSKNSEDYYDQALRDMNYSFINSEKDEDNVTWRNYERGTYKVRYSHYQSDGTYYFDVYAYNDKDPADPTFTPTSELNRSNVTLKSGYQSFSVTNNGVTYSSERATKYSSYGFQIDSNSKVVVQGNLSKMNILVLDYGFSCLVYAGTSKTDLKIVYNDAFNYVFPSGTKYVEIRTLSKQLVFENICVC